MVLPDAPTQPLPIAGDRERLPRIALGVVVVALGLAVRDPLAYAAAIGLLLLTPLERLVPRRRRQRILRRGWATDLLHLVVSAALFGLLTVVPMVLLRPVIPQITPIAHWIAAQDVLVRGLVGLIVFDLVGYVSHRLQHEVPFLWRFHRIHHSSEELDWLAGARVHPLPGVMDGLFRAVPALLLGLTRDTVFQRFARGQARAPGTGLGLALVAQQARLHGGTVAVQDAPCGGARFVVTLRTTA